MDVTSGKDPIKLNKCTLRQVLLGTCLLRPSQLGLGVLHFLPSTHPFSSVPPAPVPGWSRLEKPLVGFIMARDSETALSFWALPVSEVAHAGALAGRPVLFCLHSVNIKDYPHIKVGIFSPKATFPVSLGKWKMLVSPGWCSTLAPPGGRGGQVEVVV